MNSSRICPAVGSQDKFQQLVCFFMESVAGLAMETSKLMSNVEQEADNSKRNSKESDVVLKNQQMVCALVIISSRLQCFQQER
ncbi:hypothetical protein F511_27266 [Dorcoceras hygrometricum]|uniref:Uncharacterized protein n=1 Tax=Dorcoceras hygrometricum TaxID=472368 RepID=A0A2Z7B6F6_9LAMI|nr:hypothetical protein F511_27266 [Dorcoceras hygrometricum]